MEPVPYLGLIGKICSNKSFPELSEYNPAMIEPANLPNMTQKVRCLEELTLAL